MGSQSPKKAQKNPKEKQKSFEFFKIFHQYVQMGTLPRTKTPHYPHCGNYGTKKQAQKQSNCKPNTNS